MALKPPSLRIPWRKPKEQIDAERRAKSHKAQGKTKERGYGGDWRKVRARVLAEEPLCRECSKKGLVTPATLVDHITPIRLQPELRLERSNLQPLCVHCHSIKTIREDGGFGMAVKWKPDWLRPSAIPFTIICGPPAAGKTTYVKERQGPGDLRIDLDEIACELAGHTSHNWDRRWLDGATRIRNNYLGLLSKVPPRWPAAWMVAGLAKPEDRQWFAEKTGAKIVVMATPLEECWRRIEQDPSRAAVVSQHKDAVAKWWQTYRPWSGDQKP